MTMTDLFGATWYTFLNYAQAPRFVQVTAVAALTSDVVFRILY